MTSEDSRFTRQALKFSSHHSVRCAPGSLGFPSIQILFPSKVNRLSRETWGPCVTITLAPKEMPGPLPAGSFQACYASQMSLEVIPCVWQHESWSYTKTSSPAATMRIRIRVLLASSGCCHLITDLRRYEGHWAGFIHSSNIY